MKPAPRKRISLIEIAPARKDLLSVPKVEDFMLDLRAKAFKPSDEPVKIRFADERHGDVGCPQ
jgi:hypothetical protein